MLSKHNPRAQAGCWVCETALWWHQLSIFVLPPHHGGHSWADAGRNLLLFTKPPAPVSCCQVLCQTGLFLCTTVFPLTVSQACAAFCSTWSFVVHLSWLTWCDQRQLLTCSRVSLQTWACSSYSK